jgi:hypothetical protein
MKKYLNSIPVKELEEFVGKPFDKIDQVAVSPTNIRVNVWTKTFEKDTVVPKWSLDRSYYLYYNGIEIADLTLRKEKTDDSDD